MHEQALAIGDGCGLKLELGSVMDVADFNSGGEHPSSLRRLAHRGAREFADATGGFVCGDDIGDMMEYIAESDILQPGLDAGYHWIESLGAFSVSTTDAMTPPTDRAEVFGRISALHVLSDLWVAGAKPETMQQYLVLPSRHDPALLGRILGGFKDTCDEFGVRITGGHTRQEGSGYLVGGTATGYTKRRYDTHRPWTGNLIVATKALGTSVAIAAHKMTQQGLTDELPETTAETIRAAELSMTTDNELAVRLRQERLLTMCTDITGFGLLGHLSNLLKPVGASAMVQLDQLPVIDGVSELLDAGVHTHAGDKAQIDYADHHGNIGALDDPRFHLAFLPETSGGILATVFPHHYAEVASIVEGAGQTLTVIGELTKEKSQSSYRFAGITLN